MGSGISAAMVNKGGPKLAAALNNQAFVFHPWQNVLYVQSVHTRSVDLNNSGTSADAPLKTIARAVALAAAGDVIIVGPGHAEVITTAAGLDINKADLTIIGMGHSSKRPTISIGGAIGAYLSISGARVRMYNMLIFSALDAITKLVEISGAGVELIDCRLEDSASFQSVTGIVITVGGFRVKIRGLIAKQLTAGATSCINITGAAIEVGIHDCMLIGNYSGAVIKVDAAALDLAIGNNRLDNSNAVNIGIICGAVAASGMIYNNYITLASAVVAVTVAITLGSAIWRLYENYATDAAGLTGVLCGVAAT
jgi:hypothetical protein